MLNCVDDTLYKAQVSCTRNVDAYWKNGEPMSAIRASIILYMKLERYDYTYG